MDGGKGSSRLPQRRGDEAAAHSGHHRLVHATVGLRIAKHTQAEKKGGVSGMRLQPSGLKGLRCERGRGGACCALKRGLGGSAWMPSLEAPLMRSSTPPPPPHPPTQPKSHPSKHLTLCSSARRYVTPKRLGRRPAGRSGSVGRRVVGG